VRSRKRESSARGWQSATARFRSKLERTPVLRLEDDREIAALAVVLATGAQYRRLPVESFSDTRA
jgi:pyruvate/2-oxoglutarate dehydrogenase complex dihydrolipoamide dehydrogenase (E3) component